MKQLIFLSLFIITGCSSSLVVTQGEHGYAGALSEEYDIYHLKEVQAESASFFGFSIGPDRDSGDIVSFVGKYNRPYFHLLKNIVSGLNIIGLSAVGGSIFSGDISLQIIGALGGGLLAGALNEFVFIKGTEINAQMIATRKLIVENPNIDLFIYPKYKFSSYNGLFYNKSNVSLRSKGASLKKEVLKNSKSNVLNTDVNFFDNHSEFFKLKGPVDINDNNSNINDNTININYDPNNYIGDFSEIICECNVLMKNGEVLSPKCQAAVIAYEINTPRGKDKWEQILLMLNCD